MNNINLFFHLNYWNNFDFFYSKVRFHSPNVLCRCQNIPPPRSIIYLCDISNAWHEKGFVLHGLILKVIASLDIRLVHTSILYRHIFYHVFVRYIYLNDVFFGCQVYLAYIWWINKSNQLAEVTKVCENVDGTQQCYHNLSGGFKIIIKFQMNMAIISLIHYQTYDVVHARRRCHALTINILFRALVAISSTLFFIH